MTALVPPFTRETATAKVRMAEDGWNSRDPKRVSLVYTEDSLWRNRAEFPVGRREIVEFLTRKWNRELDYRLIKELWAFDGNRIAVRFAYEWHDDSGHWFRSYGNENWEFDAAGLMQRRFASINDMMETSDGAFWMASNGAGVLRMWLDGKRAPASRFETFPVSTEAAANRVNPNTRNKGRRALSESKRPRIAQTARSYTFAKTPISGRRDGVLERKSLTNPSWVRIST